MNPCEHVDRLLGEPVSVRVSRSPDGVWAGVTPRPTGTVTVHRLAAAGRGWALPEVAPGTEVWAPVGVVLAGYGERGGVVVARPDARSVSTFDMDAGPLPVAWLDRHRLVVPVAVPDDPPAHEPVVFEAGPFSRVRILPEVPRPPRYTLRILDIRHGTAAVPLPVGPYRAIRAHDGHFAVSTDDTVTIVGIDDGVARPLDITPVDFGWVAGFLVTIVSTSDGTEIHAYAPDGSGHLVLEVAPGAVLHHAFEPPGPWLLLGDPGTGVASRLVLVRAGDDGLSAPSWRIRGRPVCHGSVALVDESAGLRAAVVETHLTRSRVRLLTEAAPGVLRASRRHADATGLGLLDVLDWTGGTVALVGPGEHRVGRLSDVQDDEPVVSQRDDGARVWLYRPADGKEPAATVVSLLPRPAGAVRPRAHGMLPEHTHWLTRLGFAVAAVEVPLRWWPEVPDERIREHAVSTIAAAVTGTALAGPLVVQGHSFAATLALQALADTELFAAAMVSSGSYCRSLTPLGFQYEKRTL